MSDFVGDGSHTRTKRWLIEALVVGDNLVDSNRCSMASGVVQASKQLVLLINVSITLIYILNYSNRHGKVSRTSKNVQNTKAKS